MARADARVVRLADSYTLASAELRRRVIGQAASMWDQLDDWRGPQVAQFSRHAAPLVAAGRRQMASLTDAYLASVARLVTGSGRPAGVPDRVLAGIRNGAPLEEVYQRPGVTVWTAVANGTPWDAAVRLGLHRLEAMVATDLQLARTHAAREAMSADRRVTGYRRVTNGACCELCDLASDNTYSTGDLMPIHNNCSCDVEPIYADEDPGQLPAGQPTEDVGDKPVVHEHGELGPVLAVAGQRFTGVDDLAA